MPQPASKRLVTELAMGQRVSAFAPLKAALAAGDRSCAVQVIGDSTGNETTEWVYTLAQAVAAAYPAWTVHYRLWNDATQQYGGTTVIQTGTAGVRYLDGSTGTTTRALDPSVSPHISGPIDVRVKMNLADWTPTALTAVVGKSGGDPLRGWYCGINSSGSGNRPFFTWSTGGLGADLQTMTVIGTPTVADGADLWMRWVWNPNDGAGNRTLSAYQSSDGVTWTQIGSTVTTAGTTTLFNNSARGYEIGGVANGGITTMKTYEVQIRDGVDGPNIVPALPDLWPPINTSAPRSVGAPILTFVNGSQPGANFAYHNAAGRLKKMVPDFGQLVTIVSDSHNEGLYMGAAWTAYLETFRQALESARPGSPTVFVTQNPEQSGASWYREHAKRRLDLLGYCRQKNLDCIDTYQAFLNAGWPGALMLDDIHPNTAGEVIWRDAVLARFNAS